MTPLTGPCEAILVTPGPDGTPQAAACGQPGAERIDLDHRGIVGDILCDAHYDDAKASRAARILDA